MDIVDLKEVPDTLNQLAEWHQQQWSYLNPGQTLDQRIEKMQLYLNEQFIPSTFVAFDQKQLLGSVAIIECDLEDRADLSPWIASVYVQESARNKGVATRLLEYAIEQARLFGILTLYLYTDEQQEFYQRRGWSVVETRKYQDVDVTIMSFSLNSQ